jgi:hypothetical protein
MTPSTSTSVQPAATRPVVIPHLHTAAEACPFCEQPIPRDRFEQIKARIANRQREERQEVEAELQERFDREKSELAEQVRTEAREEGRRAGAEAAREDVERLQARIDQAEAAKVDAQRAESALKAQLADAQREHEADVVKVRQQAEDNAKAVREEGRREATAEMEARIADMQRERVETETALLARIEQAEDAKDVADESVTTLRGEMDQIRAAAEAQIARERQSADTRVAAARDEGRMSAESALREQVSAAEQARSEADARATAAEAQAAREMEAAEARIAAARDEGKAAGESVLREKLSATEQARADAEARANAAQERVSALQETHHIEMADRLKEQRDALEQAKTDAVNAEKSAAFDKELKLSGKIEELQRALANKTAEELGEGAEIDLYETLKGQFEGDRIERINKGQPGADILHVVIHNGQECGSILYDSKNHNAWRNEFATKLAENKVAAKADHAILSTRKFPKGARQLHVQEGVILAAPSRVATLVQIVRQHVVAGHAMRLSNEERAQKTTELYIFINSSRCRDLFKRVDDNAEKLLEMQVKEKKAHDAMWKNQGEVIRSIQKAQAEITNEIDLIVGTSEPLGQVAHE